MSGSYQIIIKKKTHFNRNRVPIEKILFFIQEYNHFLPFADNSRIIGIPHQKDFLHIRPVLKYCLTEFSVRQILRIFYGVIILNIGTEAKVPYHFAVIFKWLIVLWFFLVHFCIHNSSKMIFLLLDKSKWHDVTISSGKINGNPRIIWVINL